MVGVQVTVRAMEGVTNATPGVVTFELYLGGWTESRHKTSPKGLGPRTSLSPRCQ